MPHPMFLHHMSHLMYSKISLLYGQLRRAVLCCALKRPRGKAYNDIVSVTPLAVVRVSAAARGGVSIPVWDNLSEKPFIVISDDINFAFISVASRSLKKSFDPTDTFNNIRATIVRDLIPKMESDRGVGRIGEAFSRGMRSEDNEQNK